MDLAVGSYAQQIARRTIIDIRSKTSFADKGAPRRNAQINVEATSHESLRGNDNFGPRPRASAGLPVVFTKNEWPGRLHGRPTEADVNPQRRQRHKNWAQRPSAIISNPTLYRRYFHSRTAPSPRERIERGAHIGGKSTFALVFDE